jgi:DNA-binding NarL/FixJ family response regulator
MEVLAHLSEGLSNRAIAKRMDISENTVRTHVSAILFALGVNSRAQANVAARRAGLIQ